MRTIITMPAYDAALITPSSSSSIRGWLFAPSCLDFRIEEVAIETRHPEAFSSADIPKSIRYILESFGDLPHALRSGTARTGAQGAFQALDR